MAEAYYPEDWMPVDEAEQLALDYADSYDPGKTMLSFLTRDWISEVSNVPVVHIVGKTRVLPAVTARFVWAHCLWAAGYSYPQIGRAMYRRDHSAAYHIVHNKKIEPQFYPYRKVAIRFGSMVGKKRLAWVDAGDKPADQLTLNDNHPSGTKDDDKRREQIALMEKSMDYSFIPRVVNEHPVFRNANMKVSRKLMEDLRARMEAEALGNG